MEWQEYRQQYSNFLVMMYRTEIVTLYALENIPNQQAKQPEHGKVEFPFFANLVRAGLAQYSAGYRTDHQVLHSMAVLLFDGQNERHLCYQELPLTLAALEAFIGHSLTSIWSKSSLLLDNTRYVSREIKNGKFTSSAALSSTELKALIEETLYDIFRGSNDSYFNYLKKDVGLSLKVNIRLLVVASYKRNAIIHNGGFINERYINDLNSKDKQDLQDLNLGIGDSIPIDFAYLCHVFNELLSFGQELFEQVSTKFFEIATPLSDRERVHQRQNLQLQVNPYESAFQQIIAELGGPDKAMLEIKRLQEKDYPGMSVGQIAQVLLSEYLSRNN